MINNVTFTGRETMLGDIVNKSVQKIENVVKASSILPKLEKNETEVVYSSPFAPLQETVGKVLDSVA